MVAKQIFVKLIFLVYTFDFTSFFLLLFVYILLYLPKIVEDAAKFSQRMEHRGACSSDNATGDGAGALMAIPHDFYVKELRYEYFLLKISFLHNLFIGDVFIKS